LPGIKDRGQISTPDSMYGFDVSLSPRISQEEIIARPLRIGYPDALYHVTSRGNERKDVFTSQRDREKFLSQFELADVHTWCLTSNHYHLLLKHLRAIFRRS
jgi:hypothetical protein